MKKDENKQKRKPGLAHFFKKKYADQWAVVVAKFTEPSLSIPEDLGSNPVIGIFYWTITYLLTVCREDEDKKRSGMDHF